MKKFKILKTKLIFTMIAHKHIKYFFSLIYYIFLYWRDALLYFFFVQPFEINFFNEE